MKISVAVPFHIAHKEGGRQAEASDKQIIWRLPGRKTCRGKAVQELFWIVEPDHSDGKLTKYSNENDVKV